MLKFRRPEPRLPLRIALLGVLCCGGLTIAAAQLPAADPIRDLQTQAIATGKSPVGHWGPLPESYLAWGTHSNRLIPVYTFGTKGGGAGVDLNSYFGENSAYRSESALRRIYGRVPADTLNPAAQQMDQVDIAALQRAAFAAGKKHVILVVFDGMDWQTTQAAAIYNQGRVTYREGRGTGTHFQEYTAGGTTQFGWMCTSPHNEGTKINVDDQRVINPGGVQPGGYDLAKGGANPWTPGSDRFYIIGKNPMGEGLGPHAYPDSAATAAAMMSGVKTYNDSINVDHMGGQVETVAHEVQRQGRSVGVVTSVPISHATPACAYANNVHRDDYQDLTRDLIGRPSIAHPDNPRPGLDVLIGGGAGHESTMPKGQGKNFVPGNVWLTADDLAAIDAAKGGKYVVAQRTAGVKGAERLAEAAAEAARDGKRLFGFYGVGKYSGHLPFQTADKDYQPAPGRSLKAEQYTDADLAENPKLAEMTSAALTVLSRNPKGFWLLVEAGDVDWANHDNNLDNSIGAVNSGDAAVRAITDWVEQHSSWEETVMIVTADHGHYLVLEKPELLGRDAE